MSFRSTFTNIPAEVMLSNGVLCKQGVIRRDEYMGTHYHLPGWPGMMKRCNQCEHQLTCLGNQPKYVTVLVQTDGGIKWSQHYGLSWENAEGASP